MCCTRPWTRPRWPRGARDWLDERAVVFSGLWGVLRLRRPHPGVPVPGRGVTAGARRARRVLEEGPHPGARPAARTARCSICGPARTPRCGRRTAAARRGRAGAARTRLVDGVPRRSVVSHSTRPPRAGWCARWPRRGAAPATRWTTWSTALRDLKHTVEERPAPAGRPRQLDIVVAGAAQPRPAGCPPRSAGRRRLAAGGSRRRPGGRDVELHPAAHRHADQALVPARDQLAGADLVWNGSPLFQDESNSCRPVGHADVVHDDLLPGLHLRAVALDQRRDLELATVPAGLDHRLLCSSGSSCWPGRPARPGLAGCGCAAGALAGLARRPGSRRRDHRRRPRRAARSRPRRPGRRRSPAAAPGVGGGLGRSAATHRLSGRLVTHLSRAPVRHRGNSAHGTRPPTAPCAEPARRPNRRWDVDRKTVTIPLWFVTDRDEIVYLPTARRRTLTAGNDTQLDPAHAAGRPPPAVRRREPAYDREGRCRTTTA